MQNRPVYWGAHPLAQWAERATDAELETALEDHRAIECEREIFRRERDWRELDRLYGKHLDIQSPLRQRRSRKRQRAEGDA